MADDISARIVLEGEAETKAALRSINEALKVHDSELKLVAAQYAKNTKSAEALRAKNLTLEPTILTQSEKVGVLEYALSKASQKYGEAGTRTSQLKTELNNAQASLAKLTQEFDANEKELGEAEKATGKYNKEAENIEKSSKSGVGGLTTLKVAFGSLVADGIKLALNALKDFTKDGIEYISSLQEVQNVVETIFGSEGSRQIEEWSKTTLRSFGLAELTAKQYASTLGAILDAAGVNSRKNIEMSMTLTELAADWASFMDMKPEEAYKKIESAMTGQTAAARALGISMTEVNLKTFAASNGFAKQYKDMQESEKMMVRYKYILEASNKVMGDFAKTSDSFHNQQTLLKEQTKQLSGMFAESFLPALTDVLTTTNDYLAENGDTLANLGGIVATVVNALAMLLSVVGAIPPEVLMLTGGLILAYKAFTSIDTGLGKFVKAGKDATGMLDPFTIKIIGLIAAVSILLFLILALRDGTNEAANAMDRAGKSASNFQTKNTNAARGYATGTPSARPGLAWVGEEGPELVRFRGGEQVYTAAQSARMARQGLPGYSGGTSTPAAYYDHSSLAVYTSDDRVMAEVKDWWENKQRRARAHGAEV